MQAIVAIIYIFERKRKWRQQEKDGVIALEALGVWGSFSPSINKKGWNFFHPFFVTPAGFKPATF